MAELIRPNAAQISAVQNRKFEPKEDYIRGREHIFRKRDPLTKEPLMKKIHIVEIKNPYSTEARQGIGFNNSEAREAGNSHAYEGKPGSKGIYQYFFPNMNEAEPTADIRERLINLQFNREIFQDHPFMAIAVVHSDLGVIAYTQASVLAQPKMAYWQYGAIADKEFSKQAFGVDVNFQALGIRELMNAARLTIVEESLGARAVGTVLEMEFRGQSSEFAETGVAAKMHYTSKRLAIHEASGAKAIVCEMRDGKHIPFWYQPPLNEGRTINGRTYAAGVPYSLHMGYIPVELGIRNSWEASEMQKEQAHGLIAGLMKNFTLEGFDKYFVSARKAAAFGVHETINGVELSRTVMSRIVDNAARVLLVPLTKTKNYPEYAAGYRPLENQLRNADFEGHEFAALPLAEINERMNRIIAAEGKRQTM